ncbi:MAG: UDP-N-acetylmuramate--L-alanine ligase [Crocinitomicaceae bacterium]|nr:UDP-N-acetylmuramate--L-alanine ligase [Crocinitomicaceae bacterium]
MELKKYHNIYFLGIGGIGMSALARYFHNQGFQVSGYDKTPSELTDELMKEGIPVDFEAKSDLSSFSPNTSLIIFTPAIPKDFSELVHFQNSGFEVLKRSQVLGLITRNSKGIGVAGTHGKTTTSTMLAHVLHESELGCNAFLGGISSNYNSNLIINKDSEYTVVEADEFDRSFLQLSPFCSILTSTDPDHLDIYQDDATIKKTFQEYIDLTNDLGCCVIKKELDYHFHGRNFTYSIHEPSADFFGEKFRYDNGKFLFDIRDNLNGNKIKNVELGLPGIHNAENALAVFAMSKFLDIPEANILKSLASFKGVYRRFDIHLRAPKVYIDDYAHHPKEIKAFLESVRLLFPGKRVRAIFQPHLFSRTQDFMNDFAEELSKSDECFLMPIYPARELPIPGITSEKLLEKIQCPGKLVQKEDVLNEITDNDFDVLLTMGAGDIDRFVKPITSQLKNEKV